MLNLSRPISAFVVLLACYFTLSGQHTGSAERILKPVFPSYELEEVSTSDDSVIFNAKILHLENVKLVALLNDDKRITSIGASLPPNSDIKPSDLLSNLVDPGMLQRMMPTPLLNEAIGLRGIEIGLQDTALKMRSVTVTFSAGDLSILGLDPLTLENAMLGITISRDTGNTNIGGTISGDLDIAKSKVHVVAGLSTNKEEMVFEGSTNQDISMSSLIQSIAGEELLDEINNTTPPGVLDLMRLPAFQFSIKPYAGSFNASVMNDLGEVKAVIEQNEEEPSENKQKFLYSLSYTPNQNFTFAGVHTTLAPLDQANFLENVQLLLSNNYATAKKSKSGIVGVKLTADLKKSVVQSIREALHQDESSFPHVSFEGAINKNLNIGLRGNVELDLDLGKGFKFQRVGVTLDFINAPILGMDGMLIVPLDGTNLAFQLGLLVEPVNMAIGGSFDLVSVNGNQEITAWEEPFGLPYVTFYQIGGQLSVSASTLVDNIGIRGKIKLGEIPGYGYEDRRIQGDVDVVLDVNISQSKVKATLENLNVLSAIEAFNTGVLFPDGLKKFLNTGINNATVNISPAERTLEIAGDATYFSTLDGDILLKVGSGGFKAGGGIKPISVKPSGVNIFSLNAKGNPSLGPSFGIDISTNPKIDFTGEATVFGIKASETKMGVNTGGVYFTAGLNIAEIGKGDFTISGENIKVGKLGVNGNIYPDAIGNIKAKLTQYIRDHGGAVAGEIVNTVLPSFGISNIAVAYNQDNVISKIKSGINFYAEIFGQRTDFSVDVDLTADFNNPETIITEMVPAMAEAIIASFGNFVAEIPMAIYEGGKQLAVGLGTAIYEGGAVMMDAADHVFGDRTFTAPSGGGYGGKVPTGYRHIQISVNEIVITYPADNGDDVYGQIGMFLTQPSNKHLVEQKIGMIFLDSDGIDFSGEAKERWNNLVKSFPPPKTVTAAPNTNLFFYGRSEGSPNMGMLANSRIPISHTKHFYIRHGEAISLRFIGDLYEKDASETVTSIFGDKLGGAINSVDADKNLRGHKWVDVPATAFNESSSFACSGDGGSYTVNYNVKADPQISGTDLLNAVKANNLNQLKEYVRLGGDLRAVGSPALDQAVQNKNLEMTASINKSGIPIQAHHLGSALAGEFKQDLVIYILHNGQARPNHTHINTALDLGHDWLVKAMIENKGGQPNNENLTKALQKNKLPLVKMILNRNVKPSSADLSLAIGSKNKEAVVLLLSKNAPAANSHVLEALNKGTWDIAKMLAAKTTPDPSALDLALTKAPDHVSVYLLGRTTPNDNNLRVALKGYKLSIAKMILDRNVPPTQGHVTDMINAKNWEGFQLLIDYKAPLSTGHLNSAIQNNQWEMAKYINSQITPNPDNLLKAVLYAPDWLGKEIIDRGAAPTNHHLSNALIKDKLITAKAIMDKGVKPKSSDLHSMLRSSKEKAALLLLSYNVERDIGHLNHAAEQKMWAIAEIILKDVTPNQKTYNITAAKNETSFFRKLCATGVKITTNEPGVSAVTFNNLAILKLSFEHGVDAKEIIYYASERNRKEAVAMCVDYGADPNRGVYPAVVNANLEIVQMLIGKYKADATPNRYIHKATELSDRGSHLKVLRYLLNQGANPNGHTWGDDKNTLLHLACERNRRNSAGNKVDRDLDLVKLLVEYKAEIDATNADGWTTLHMASNRCRNDEARSIVMYLVEQGADINACTSKGKSVIQIADGVKIKKFLKEKGAEKKVCP